MANRKEATMMQAYIALSYSHRLAMNDVVDAMVDTLNRAGISAHVFVDVYQFDAAGEKEMMEQAMTDIAASNILLAETTHKAIGVGVEAGYARALCKPVIYIRKANAEHSTTISGISQHQIIYQSIPDLQTQLQALLQGLFSA